MENIPVLHVTEETLAEAYEAALKELWENGTRFKTQYDKLDDPMSIDATMNITVLDPLKDPMIHKAFPGSIGDLREYVMELEGAKDHWVKNINDPDDTRWEYTYYGRFKNWGTWKQKSTQMPSIGQRITSGLYEVDFTCLTSPQLKLQNIDQFESVVDKLVKQPFTRQAQIITWMPNLDLNCYDAPCLQSIWCRILEDKEGVYYLNYNVRFRSNDAWGAYAMNAFGITMMVKELIADKIAERTGKTVKLGRMNWQADSWHIYGKDIEQAKARLFDRLDKTNFEDRTYNFNDLDIQEMYEEATEMVVQKIKVQDDKTDRK